MPKWALIRSHERCWLLKTAGRWPWKSESAKECVTTHLPKQIALKMDGAKAPHLYVSYSALSIILILTYVVVVQYISSKVNNKNCCRKLTGRVANKMMLIDHTECT